MDILIGILLGTRLFTFLTGGLSPGDVQAYLSPPQIIISQSGISVQCQVVNAYPKQLKELAKTSTPVYLYLYIELREGKDNKTVSQHTEESVLVYDIINRRYCVKQSSVPDTVRIANIDSALAEASMFYEVPVITPDRISAGQEYWLNVYAILGKTRIEALDNKEIDLMYYWDYKRPSIKTEAFAGKQLLSAMKK
jgi:hypothetical protein